MGTLDIRVLRGLVVSAAAAALVPLGAASAAASGSAYGQWSMAANPGTLSVPATGFPSAAVTTTSSSVIVGQGSSAFLNAATPFGAGYGSSRGKQYLALRTARGGAPSRTTISFATPPAAGWAFALGDVDADRVRVSATDPSGDPVSVADLGWQGAFNYCAGSPRPSTCTGPGPFTDRPTWDAATGTLVGSGTDTGGASGWLRPVVPVKSLTLRFEVQTGIPIYQLWVAALTASISGRVDATCGSPAGAVLHLRQNDGSPVLDSHGDPVTVTSGSDGGYAFTDLAPAAYRVSLQVPAGRAATETTKNVDIRDGDATGVDFGIHCAPTKPAKPKGDVITVTGHGHGHSPVTSPGPALLAETGTDGAGPLAAFGLALLIVGGVTRAVSSRRRA